MYIYIYSYIFIHPLAMFLRKILIHILVLRVILEEQNVKAEFPDLVVDFLELTL